MKNVINKENIEFDHLQSVLWGLKFYRKLLKRFDQENDVIRF